MAAYDAISLPEVKEALRIEGTDGDKHLQTLVTGLTLELERLLGTQFVQRSVVEYHPGGQRRMYLSRAPITAVASIVDTQSPTPATVAATDYTIRQRRWLERAGGTFPTAYDANGNASEWTVTYTAGWFATTAVVSADVKEQIVRVLNSVRTSPETAIRSSSSSAPDMTAASSVKVGDLAITYASGSTSASQFSSYQGAGGLPAAILAGAAEALFAYRGVWL